MEEGGGIARCRNLEEVRESNKMWMRRLKMVLELEKWVADNLKDQGLYNPWPRTEDQKISDAKDYVYGYLFWGRRKFPEADDPLFFINDGRNGHDESMRKQLKDNKYEEFITIFNECIGKLDQDFQFISDVLPGDVVDFVEGDTEFIRGLRGNLEFFSYDELHDTENLIIAEMIGLVLRYRCVGGFDSNMHGSIDPRWAGALPGFVECFASPLNHKFRTYHSMFDEDCYFGGKGDFFKFVKQKGGFIPPGKYEINPPFHEGLLNDVAVLIDESFKQDLGHSKLQVVLVVPDWDNTSFIPVLDELSTRLHNSDTIYTKRFNFTHSNGGNLSVKTRFYVLCSENCERGLVDGLKRAVGQLVFGPSFRHKVGPHRVQPL